MMLASEAAYATETVPFGAGVGVGVELLLVVEPQAASNRRKIRLKTRVGK